MKSQQETNEQALKELQELRQQFNDFLYFLPDALLEIDLLAPRLTYMNRMAYIVFGYTETDFAAGIEISSLFAEGEYERAVRIITDYVGDSLSRKTAYARSGKQDTYEFLMRRKDGSVFHAETQTSFVLGEDRIPMRMRTMIRDVTARKRAEEATREHETWLRLVIEQLPAILWTTDAELRITSSVGAGLAALNLKPNQINGMTISEYFQTEDQDFPPIATHRQALAGESATYEQEWAGNCYQVHLEPLRDAQGHIIGCIGIALDITTRKRAQQELQENEALYHALFETVPVGLGIADLEGKLLAYNEAMLKPGEYTRADIEQIGNVARLYYDPEDRNISLALARQQGYLDRHEVRFKRKDGSPYHTLLSLRPILIKGKRCWQAVVEDITERKRAEEVLRQQQEEQQVIFDSVPAMIWYKDQNNKILRVNKPAAESIGLPVEAIEGRWTHELYPDEAAQYHGDDLQVIRSGEPKLGIIEQLQTESGEKRWIQTDKVPYRDETGNIIGVIVFALDITERKKAEEALHKAHTELELRVQERTAELRHANTVLQEQIAERKCMEVALRRSEERYRALYEDNPSMYFTVDAEGTVLSVNRFGAEQLGCEVAELLEQPVLNVFYEEDKLFVQQHLAACRQSPKQTFHWEVRKVHKNGSLLWVREAARAVQDANGKTMVLIVCEDITETKNLRQRAERMERLAALGQLSTTIAHEIRNPLGSISLNFQYLTGRLEIPEPHKKTFRSIEQGMARIQNIINGILDFARPVPLALKKTNLHKVLDSSLNSAKHELEQAGIRLEKNYQAAHRHVLIDANLMGQVFVNLFLNAKDAMAPGGQLRVHTASDEKSLIVQIADTGKGIPPEHLEKIYDPFFTTKTDGIGLGLAVVTRILEQHQAQIAAESQVGHGTKFIITLPLAPENGAL
ncbi:MAG: PAS domain S-box protein [bacterium]